MSEPPKATRFMRGIVVVLMAGGVVVMGKIALTMHNGRRMLMEHGAGSLIGMDTMVYFVALFLFFILLFLYSLRTAIREWPTAPSSHFSTQNLGARFGESFREPSKDFGPAYRWGMLAVVLLLLAWDIRRQLNLSPAYSGDRYGNLVVGLMLLLNHLAWCFRFPPTVTFALRVLASGWVILGGAYVFSR